MSIPWLPAAAPPWVLLSPRPMISRVTDSQLEAVVRRINLMTGSPLEPYSQVDGKLRANIGCFHLDHAYGGVALHRMQNEGGGITDVLQIGYPSKRELLDAMFAFIRGLELGSEVAS